MINRKWTMTHIFFQLNSYGNRFSHVTKKMFHRKGDNNKNLESWQTFGVCSSRLACSFAAENELLLQLQLDLVYNSKMC